MVSIKSGAKLITDSAVTDDSIRTSLNNRSDLQKSLGESYSFEVPAGSKVTFGYVKLETGLKRTANNYGLSDSGLSLDDDIAHISRERRNGHEIYNVVLKPGFEGSFTVTKNGENFDLRSQHSEISSHAPEKQSERLMPLMPRPFSDIQSIQHKADVNDGRFAARPAPVFQAASRFVLPPPPVPRDADTLSAWLTSHHIHDGEGTPAQRNRAIHSLWQQRAIVEARSGNDSYEINKLLDKYPHVLSGAIRTTIPTVEAEFQTLENELRNNYRSYNLQGPYTLDFNRSTKNLKVIPVQSSFTDAEIARADTLIDNFNNLTHLRERYPGDAEVRQLTARMGQSMLEIRRHEPDFALKLKDYVSPVSTDGMFAGLNPEERIKFIHFMDYAGHYAVPKMHHSILTSTPPGRASFSEIKGDIAAVDDLSHYFADKKILKDLSAKIISRVSLMEPAEKAKLHYALVSGEIKLHDPSLQRETVSLSVLPKISELFKEFEFIRNKMDTPSGKDLARAYKEKIQLLGDYPEHALSEETPKYLNRYKNDPEKLERIDAFAKFLKNPEEYEFKVIESRPKLNNLYKQFTALVQSAEDPKSQAEFEKLKETLKPLQAYRDFARYYVEQDWVPRTVANPTVHRLVNRFRAFLFDPDQTTLIAK